MKRKLLSFISALLILTGLSFSATASPALLIDEEALLSEHEAELIEDSLELLSDEYGMDFVIVTSPDFDRKAADDFADDYYDYGGYDRDGIILVVSDNLGEVFISTSGDGMYSFSDNDVELMLDAIIDELSYGEYADALEEFISECERLYDNGEDSSVQPFLSTKQIIICAVIGIIIGFIGVSSMKSGMKTVRAKTNAREYMVSESLELTEKHDTFLYRNISRVRRQNNSSSEGNRIGSSGRSHGGSGRSFR